MARFGLARRFIRRMDRASGDRQSARRNRPADRAGPTRTCRSQRRADHLGGLAYYSFHLAYDRPSDFAFAALGQRDIAPWMHRIRMLALESQIFETDAEQAESALIGRLEWLEATVADGKRLWSHRLLVRLGLLAWISPPTWTERTLQSLANTLEWRRWPAFWS